MVSWFNNINNYKRIEIYYFINDESSEKKFSYSQMVPIIGTSQETSLINKLYSSTEGNNRNIYEYIKSLTIAESKISKTTSYRLHSILNLANGTVTISEGSNTDYVYIFKVIGYKY